MVAIYVLRDENENENGAGGLCVSIVKPFGGVVRGSVDGGVGVGMRWSMMVAEMYMYTYLDL